MVKIKVNGRCKKGGAATFYYVAFMMKRLDVLIIIGVLVLAGIFFLVQYINNQSPEAKELIVEVYYDGQLVESVGITERKEIHVDTDIGHNTILVDHGTVSMIEADCPDKICMYGSIDQTTESIVCLPNRVHVEIKGQEEGDIDAITR